MPTIDEIRAALGPGADPNAFRRFLAENMMLADEHLRAASLAIIGEDDRLTAFHFRAAQAHMDAARATFRDIHTATHAA